jgi:NDP-sugar pyrophosphorylase family protein
MDHLQWGLFSLTGLPAEIVALLQSAASPVEALNQLPHTLRAMLSEQQEIHGEVAPGVHLSGAVYIGPGSSIASGVVIEGPVYIGANVSVRPHANIRHGAVLLNDVVIGHSGDVKNSLVLPGAKIQDGTFAGDSLLGHGARIGSGAILANRKFNQGSIKVSYGEALFNGQPVDSGRDFLGAIIGDQARLGANVITSPGTVVGPHTWVGSGAALNGYHGPDQLITVKQELHSQPKERQQLKAGKAITYDYL